MHAPLISKIRCHNPNKQKSRVCNRNYLIYIATREGVDLSDPLYDQTFESEVSHMTLRQTLKNPLMISM